MAKIRTVDLSEKDRTALEEGYKNGKTHSYRMRCRAVLLKSEGLKSTLVGQMLDLHQVTVNQILDRWESQGLAGLSMRTGRGRKATLQVHRDGQLVRRAIEQERQRLSQAKVALEAELGKTFSERTLRRFLKNLAADTNVSAGG